jgi:hypothetical protein
MPNGKIIELTDDFTPLLPFQQATNLADLGTLLSNLVLAKQALLSDSPYVALALHRLMIEISFQSFGKQIPNLSEILVCFLIGETPNFHVEISYQQMQTLTDYQRICGGCWKWESTDNDK